MSNKVDIEFDAVSDWESLMESVTDRNISQQFISTEERRARLQFMRTHPNCGCGRSTVFAVLIGDEWVARCERCHKAEDTERQLLLQF